MIYTYEEAFNTCLNYFNGDELAAKTVVNKYLLRDENNELIEKSPTDKHKRIAKELYRLEKKKYDGRKKEITSELEFEEDNERVLSEDYIFSLLDNYKYIVPQGSIMAGLGDTYRYVSLSNCVYGESLVYTKEYGLVKMKDIKVGTHVLTHKGRFRKVLKHWSNGIKDTYTLARTFTNKRISIRDEQEMSRFLAVTPEHLVYTEDEKWIKVEDFKNKKSLKELKEPKLNYRGNIPSFFPLDHGKHVSMDNNFAWICGLYLAEGAIKKQDSNHPSVYFTIHKDEQDIVERVRKFTQVTLGSDCWVQEWPEYNFIQINIFDPSFAHLMDMLFGCGFDKKRLPEWCFGLSEDTIKSLLDGFLTGDATNYENLDDTSLFFSIANPTLAYELGLLSRNANYHCRFNFLCKGKLIKHRTISTRISNENTRIQSISSPVSVEVFDMEVEEDHSFVAGDIICHNCFVVPSPYDSYGGILKTDEHIVQISKRRGGIGYDISSLRPEGLIVNNCARTTSGAISFMDRFSNTGREVGQNNRRAAQMITISVHHPNIEQFIEIKRDLKKVTGANISIRLSDEFLNAVQNEQQYEVRWPLEGQKKISEYKSAKNIWNKIISAARDMAEPGLLFWDNILRESPADCYAEDGFKTVSTNPCCFSETKDVFVITNNGVKEIKEISSNDLVWVDEKKKFYPTTGYFKVGTHDVYKVILSNNEELYITNNHKLAKAKFKRVGTKTIYNGYELVELKDLEIGDRISIHKNDLSEQINWPENGSYDEGLILGWMTGDGCLSYKNDAQIYPSIYLDFWSQEHDVAELIHKVILDMQYEVELSTNSVNNIKRLQFTKLTEDLTNKYNLNIWKFKSDDKVNEFLFNSSKEFIIGYLRAYFTADGTVTSNLEAKSYQVSLSSTSKKRLEQIKSILLNFGIKSQIYLSRKACESEFKNGGKYQTKDCWKLVISGKIFIERFAKYIGFLSSAKQKLLDQLIDIYIDRAEKNRDYVLLKSIEYIGKENVGCIEVEEEHTLTANGIISGQSELPLSEFDSCRLLVINIFSYIVNPFTNKAYLDKKKLYIHAQIAQRLMDHIVDLELECINKIISKIKSDPEPEDIKSRELELWTNVHKSCTNGRRTGTGITGLGDTLAALDIKYGSDESILRSEEIYKIIKFGCYRSSVDMAKTLGAFPVWDHKKEKDCVFLNRFSGDTVSLNNPYSEKLEAISGEQIYRDMKKYGRRNISLLTIAPTGTLSILTQTTSGVEPVFMLSYTRRKKLNHDDKHAKVDFVDEVGDKWTEFEVRHKRLQDWMDITGEKDVACSPYFNACAEEINWENRVKLQSAIQKHCDHSISSTINLPEHVSTEEVKQIYETAWRSCCKGITVYRKNSRSGVLIEKKDTIVKTNAVKRPLELMCDIHHINVKGEPYFVAVGLLDSEPYEVFAARNNCIDDKIKSGKLIKMKRPKGYKAELDDGTIISPITMACTDNEETVTRLISMSLRHGASVQFVAEQLAKTHGEMTNFSKAIGRTLKKYIKDGTKSSEECPECSSKLIFENGCVICKNCGMSKCS